MLASAPPQAENVTLVAIEKDVHDAKCRIQTMKQEVEILKRNVPMGVDLEQMKPKKTEIPNPRIVARWTNDELLLAAQGIRRYGKDFTRIAEIVSTKTEKHVKSFYVNYKARFGLDAQVAEHELEELNTDLETPTSAVTTPIKSSSSKSK